MLKNLCKFTFLILLVISISGKFLYAQDGTVKGKIIDETGQPVPGASVTVKGSQQGTLSNVDGTYSLAASGQSTLVFSFVGYLKEEITVNNKTTIDITLKVDQKALDEVVVVGY